VGTGVSFPKETHIPLGAIDIYDYAEEIRLGERLRLSDGAEVGRRAEFPVS
jgi:hypothetical protein